MVTYPCACSPTVVSFSPCFGPLGLDDADRFTIEEKGIICLLALLCGHIPDSYTYPGAQVEFMEILNEPATGNKLPIYLIAGYLFGILVHWLNIHKR
jgi:hypothetical protein